jgi:hypothetical protein
MKTLSFSAKLQFQATSSRLNNIGNIKVHSAFVNDPKSLQCMQEKWLLAKSMGTVSAFKDAEVKSKNNAEQKELYEILPIALDKYQNNERNKAFIKGMMKAILVLVFGDTPPSTAKRDVLLQLLDENVQLQPTKIADVIQNPLEARDSVAAACSGTARASWHNALWFYNLCNDFVAESGLKMTGVQLALIALRELIWIRGQGYNDEWFEVDSNWNSILWRLSNRVVLNTLQLTKLENFASAEGIHETAVSRITLGQLQECLLGRMTCLTSLEKVN